MNTDDVCGGVATGVSADGGVWRADDGRGRMGGEVNLIETGISKDRDYTKLDTISHLDDFFPIH